MPSRVLESASAQRLVSVDQHAHSVPSNGSTSALLSCNVDAVLNPEGHPQLPPVRPMLKPVPTAHEGMSGSNTHVAVFTGNEEGLMQAKHRACGPQDGSEHVKFLGSGKGRVNTAAAGCATLSSSEAGFATFDAPSVELFDSRKSVASRPSDSLKVDMQGERYFKGNVKSVQSWPPDTSPAAGSAIPPPPFAVAGDHVHKEDQLFTRKRAGAFRQSTSWRPS